jgi:peptide/nickel transport system substrate-binding protein
MDRQYPPGLAETGYQSGEFDQMSVRQSLLAATLVSMVAFAVAPASAQTLRYANQGDLKSLDPYTLKETTTIAHHGHVYEGLVARDKDLKCCFQRSACAPRARTS